jgi:hypothetical protein
MTTSRVARLGKIGALLAFVAAVGLLVCLRYLRPTERAATRRLALPAEPGERVPALWRTVETGAPGEVSVAERELGQLASQGVDIQLPSHLDHESWRVRAAAVGIIRASEMKYYLPGLICRLSDVNWRVRYAAAVTLEALTARSCGRFEMNTPLDSRERSILEWHEYWVSSDPEDGWTELVRWYAVGGHLEMGTTLADRLFGPEVSAVAAALREEEEYPIRVEASVRRAGGAQLALTLVVIEPPADTAPPQAGRPLCLTVSLLDRDGAVLGSHSVPYEPREQTAAQEPSASFTFPLPANTDVVEYAVVWERMPVPDAPFEERLFFGRIRLQDVGFAPSP